MEHRELDVDGQHWHYVEGGAGSTIVLAAGFPQSWWAWRRVIPILMRRFHVIAIDLPGQGDSGPSTAGYDTWSVAALLDAFFDRMGLERIVFAGHDVGAWVGFAFAHRFPQRLAGVVLLDADIAGVNLDLDDDGGYGGWHFIFQRVPDLPELMFAGHERAIIEWFAERLSAHPESTFEPADFDEYERAYSRPSSLEGMLGYYRAVPENAAHPITARERHLTVPTLVIVGDRMSTRAMVEQLALRAPDFASVILPDTRHYVAEERPTEVAGAIGEFAARAVGR